MVLVYSISPTLGLVKRSKYFWEKGGGQEKPLTYPPRTITHENEGEHTLRPISTPNRSILQGENDLARIGLLE
jgi:hypothetical protein